MPQALSLPKEGWNIDDYFLDIEALPYTTRSESFEIIFYENRVEVQALHSSGASKSWRAKYTDFDGVLFRAIEYTERSTSTEENALPQRLYVVELKHKEPDKSLELARAEHRLDSKTGPVHAAWRYYAEIFRLPALRETSGGLKKTAYADLEKPIIQLEKERKVRRPGYTLAEAPRSLKPFRMDGDEGIEHGLRMRPTTLQIILTPILLALGFLFGFIIINNANLLVAESAAEPVDSALPSIEALSVYGFGIAVILITLIFLIRGIFCRTEFVVTRQSLLQRFACKRFKSSLAVRFPRDAIEGIEVMTFAKEGGNQPLGKYEQSVLRIEAGKKALEFDIGYNQEDLQWMKRFFLSHVIR